MVKAGLLPRLAGEIMTVALKRPLTTRSLAFSRGSNRDAPICPKNWDWSIPGGPTGRGIPRKKVLLVLDQFEQWLHAKQGRRTRNW